jgi:hypothetical protein
MSSEQQLADYLKKNPGFGISPHFTGTLARLICQEFNVQPRSVDDRPLIPRRVVGFNPDDTTKQGN